jgi:hypothetical protein
MLGGKIDAVMAYFVSKIGGFIPYFVTKTGKNNPYFVIKYCFNFVKHTVIQRLI